MMLDYLGYNKQAQALTHAIEQTYNDGIALPVDQGGQAGTLDFVSALRTRLT
jgi:isocitrate/isopropylmalate dehydrogenase